MQRAKKAANSMRNPKLKKTDGREVLRHTRCGLMRVHLQHAGTWKTTSYIAPDSKQLNALTCKRHVGARAVGTARPTQRPKHPPADTRPAQPKGGRPQFCKVLRHTWCGLMRVRLQHAGTRTTFSHTQPHSKQLNAHGTDASQLVSSCAAASAASNAPSLAPALRPTTQPRAPGICRSPNPATPGSQGQP